MKFAEELPPQCPPADAADVAHGVIYRLIPESTPIAKHFLSHAALERPTGNADPCSARGCSLVTDPVKWVNGLPRLKKRYRYAAKLEIPAGSGISQHTKDATHVNFWAYASFDFVGAVLAVMELPGAANDD